MENQLKIRDLRKKEQFIIDDQYLNGWAQKCGIYATGVYVSLCRHANKEQKCWPSIRKISEELKISPTMVQRGFNILCKYKIILIKRVGKGINNRYILLDKSHWVGVPQDSTLYNEGGVLPHTSECATTDTHCATTGNSIVRIHKKDAQLRIEKNKKIIEEARKSLAAKKVF